MQRLSFTLNIGYVPVQTEAERANELAHYIGALSQYPCWTLSEAFDRWNAQHKRRPAIAELVILCRTAQEPIVTELAWREKAAAEQRERDAISDRRRGTREQRAEAAARALAENGFGHLIPSRKDAP